MKMREYVLILFCILVNNTVVKAQIITTIAGTPGVPGYSGDGGAATAAKIRQNGGIYADNDCNVYIADGANQRIRKVDGATGIISTVAGTGVAGYNGDGIPATNAQLNMAGLVIANQTGDLYIADGNNFRIRKVDAVTGIITTIAGTGTFGSTGDGGPATAAKIYGGFMAFDRFGNLYVGDDHRIRKINPAGIITTIAGDGLAGLTAEGVLATSTHITPQGIGTDGEGNIYFSDSTRSIRKITVNTGILTRVGGTGDAIDSPFTDGALANACHIGPLGIAVDYIGNIYIADHGNSRIERIDAATRRIWSIAGTGVAGYAGDGGPATACQLHESTGVAIDGSNNVYIMDWVNYVARKITYHTSCDSLVKLDNKMLKEASKFIIYPNPATDELNIEGAQPQTTYQLYNIVGAAVQGGHINAGGDAIAIKHLPPGLYLLALTDEEGKRTVHKIVKE